MKSSSIAPGNPIKWVGAVLEIRRCIYDPDLFMPKTVEIRLHQTDEPSCISPAYFLPIRPHQLHLACYPPV